MTRANLIKICENAKRKSDCPTYIGLGKWSICGLADGQIEGPGRGGAIKDLDQALGCWVVCKGANIK